MSWFLRAQNLSRTYPGTRTTPSVTALERIELSLAGGECLAIVGRSGSGKSTLLGLLAGFDRPTTGEVVVEGRSLSGMSPSELAEYRRTTAGFVFQSGRLLPHLSAQANVALPLVLAGVPPCERAARAEHLLVRVGLEQRMHHYPSQLSGGEQQRVALARSLANQPRLLLADEPTAGLDRPTARDIADWLFSVAAEDGLTLVIATHDQALAARCTRTLDLGALASGLDRAA
jgi:predicted ABC-type transport system involved in lysophospholipase L1 biosynthesis ATPase subunit